jgi:hypothetical protein
MNVELDRFAFAEHHAINRLVPSANILILGDLEVPQTGREPENPVDDGRRLASDSVRQAVEVLHSADRMLDKNPSSGMLQIGVFLVFGQLRRRVAFRFSRFFVRQTNIRAWSVIFASA